MSPDVESQSALLHAAFSGTGVVVSIDADDVDAIQRLTRAGALKDIVVTRPDEVWGQRHFSFRDPAGTLVDVLRRGVCFGVFGRPGVSVMTNESVPVDQLRNIGPTIARRLQEIGIRTASDLRSVGAVAAYQRICATHPGTTIPVCYYLYSLEGALRGQHWDALRPKIKQDLLSQVEGGLKKRRANRRTSSCSGP